MPLSALLRDLQQLERAAAVHHGPLIFDAFRRHSRFEPMAVYLRDGDGLRLAAKGGCTAPVVLQLAVPAELSMTSSLPLEPQAQIVLPIRAQRDEVGLIALTGGDTAATDDEIDILRSVEAFLSAVMSNHRLLQETREGDFQLKYRLWELESLYDIGLSIAATLNIDELADEILFRMISLTNARRGALFLREGDRFRLYRSFGETEGEFLETDLAEQLVREGAPLSFEQDTACIFPECKAFVAIPIRGNNDVIGVLAAADRESRDGSIGAFEANELRLLSLFASQVAIALENARLHREALEKQAMERELELAATIQRDILPKGIPELAGVTIASLSRPAKQVGGDYHAYFVRDGVLSMLVADVSGKSMPAALLVSALHAALQLMFAEGRELGEIATELNRHIHRWSAENKFITMIMVAVDPENEVLEFVNAGHNPAYVVTGDSIDVIRSHGLPVGILPTTQYSTQRRPFPAGSLAVLYSDGITEAENDRGEEFENDRLETVIRDHATRPVGEIRDAIESAVEEFARGTAQKDDQTLVIVRTA